LEHYTLLGGPGGEAFTLADMTRAQLDAPDFLELLQEAGVLYLGGENPLPIVSNLYNTQALRYIVEGFSTLQGLSLMGSAAGAAALGRWVFTPEPPHQQAMGFGFLLNAVVVPHFTATENSPILKALPKIDPGLLGLGVPDGTALALGPQGQVEMWGESHVTAVVAAADEAADETASG
jgi:cyanophycinase-like exopeptidase